MIALNILNINVAKIFSKYAGISKKKREKENMNLILSTEKEVDQQTQSFLLFKEKEKQIIKDTEKYNRAAELYFQRKENDLYIRNKPFELEKPNLIIQNRFALLIHALNISRADLVLDFGAGTCWTSALLN